MNAYALYGEVIDDSENVSGEKFALYAKGRAKVQHAKWKDWAIATKASIPFTSGSHNTLSSQDGLMLSGTTPASVIIPIDYESGTVLEGCRVKWSSSQAWRTMTISYLKRTDASSTGTSWTTIGSSGVNNNSTAVEIDSDVESFEIQDGYSDAIKLDFATSVPQWHFDLYSIGIQTSVREQ